MVQSVDSRWRVEVGKSRFEVESHKSKFRFERIRMGRVRNNLGRDGGGGSVEEVKVNCARNLESQTCKSCWLLTFGSFWGAGIQQMGHNMDWIEFILMGPGAGG